MTDFLYLALISGFFAATWALAPLDRQALKETLMSSLYALGAVVSALLLVYLFVALLLPEKLQ